MSMLTADAPTTPHWGKALLGVALVTAAILAIPLVAMQFTPDVQWTGFDFLAAAILLGCAGLVLVWVMGRLRTARARMAAVGLLGLGFLYCWAELAVGIFTDLGS